MAQSATFSEARSKYHGKRMSLAEYEALPEEKPYLEYWDGVVLQKPVPREDHWMLQGILTMRIVTYALQVGDSPVRRLISGLSLADTASRTSVSGRQARTRALKSGRCPQRWLSKCGLRTNH